MRIQTDNAYITEGITESVLGIDLLQPTECSSGNIGTLITGSYMQDLHIDGEITRTQWQLWKCLPTSIGDKLLPPCGKLTV